MKGGRWIRGKGEVVNRKRTEKERGRGNKKEEREMGRGDIRAEKVKMKTRRETRWLRREKKKKE